jgi:hypothetical protein
VILLELAVMGCQKRSRLDGCLERLTWPTPKPITAAQNKAMPIKIQLRIPSPAGLRAAAACPIPDATASPILCPETDSAAETV